MILGKLTGNKFQIELRELDIRTFSTMVKNLQANAISEHIHNTFGDIIQKLVRENLPNTIKNIIERVDKVITSEQNDL